MKENSDHFVSMFILQNIRDAHLVPHFSVSSIIKVTYLYKNLFLVLHQILPEKKITIYLFLWNDNIVEKSGYRRKPWCVTICLEEDWPPIPASKVFPRISSWVCLSKF